MKHWITNTVFYHIYPLGFCGAPQQNDFSSSSIPRLEKINEWLDHIQSLGVNAIYLGPLFESSSHGYDTVDYYHVDRRLGNDETLWRLSHAIHQRGMRLIFDAVFNHTGRDFWAFRDILQNGSSSPYCDWYQNLQFGQQSPYHDPFRYEGWNGYFSLVKLNLKNPKVKEHLYGAVAAWIRDYQVDGLRLDAADCLDFDFLRELNRGCRQLRSDFWLMGEVIHGDYNQWANRDMLDSVTNYECYKGLYSSHVDRNYFEIAYGANRQSGDQGIYRDLVLYNFVDNHDVNRIASNLMDQADLAPVNVLLFTLPGVPSIYYGSEWGVLGRKENNSDLALRPELDLQQMRQKAPQPDLPGVISRLAQIRHTSLALQSGSYRQLMVSHQQFAFLRTVQDEAVIVVVNSAEGAAQVTLNLPCISGGVWLDVLNTPERFMSQGGKLVMDVPPKWARILREARE